MVRISADPVAIMTLGLVQVLYSYSVTVSPCVMQCPGLEVIKFEYSLRLKIKRNDWLLADTSGVRSLVKQTEIETNWGVSRP